MHLSQPKWSITLSYPTQHKTQLRRKKQLRVFQANRQFKLTTEKQPNFQNDDGVFVRGRKSNIHKVKMKKKERNMLQIN